MDIVYRSLRSNEIHTGLFSHFTRHQVVTDCRRKADGVWVVRPDPFIDDWSEEDYAFLVRCLRHTLQTGGAVFGAFVDDALKGFASVEAEPLGRDGGYRDLTSLHVSEELRGQGIGKTLFQMAATWGKEHGAKKLYISSHSAVETQAFYRAMGCVDTPEPNAEHVRREPFDCQLEYTIGGQPMDLLTLMQSRRSVRQYTEDSIPDDKLTTILQAGLLSPSSRGRQPWEFIVVRDRDTLSRLAECRVGSARMLAGADAAIVVIADEEKTDVWVEDCSIAMAHMHLMADSLGLGSCWIQGRLRETPDGRSTESYVRELLHFPDTYRLEAILSLGVPQSHPEPHPLDTLPVDKVHREAY